MTTNQLITFTALPGGQTKTGLAISAYITPDLDGSGQLGDFPAFSHWPDFVRQIAFKAHFRRPDGSDLGILDLVASPLNPIALKAWQAAFPLGTRVGDSTVMALAATGTPKPPATYDVVGIRDAIREIYAADVSSQDGRKGRPGANPTKGIRRYDRATLENPHLVSTAGAARTERAFHNIQAFHLSPQSSITPLSRAPEKPEFCEVLTAAAQYPFLLRLLGLVIDFEVDAERVPLGDQQVSIVPYGNASLFGSTVTNVVAPWTTYRHAIPAPGVRVFRPLGADAKSLGLLNLGDGRFEFATEDLDGGAYTLLDYVERADLDDEAPLPALRNKGVQLFDTAASEAYRLAAERSKAIADQAHTAATTFPPPPNAFASAPVLFNDDLVRGFRVDVRSADGGKWRSLCQRASISMLTGVAISSHEEGFVVESLSSANEASTGSTTRSSSILFRWNGWSPIVSRPGSATKDDGTPIQTGSGSAVFAIADSILPGTLTRLRYGHSYQFRCREVDLAGNGWSTDDAALPIIEAAWPLKQPVITYRRHDPVLPPQLGKANTKDGAIRLIFASQGTQWPRVAKLAASAPLAVLDTVEKHGIFDAMTPSASYSILKRTASKVGSELANLIDPAFNGVHAEITWPEGNSGQGTVRVRPGILDVDTAKVAIRARTGDFGLHVSRSSFEVSVPPGRAVRLAVSSFLSKKTLTRFETHGGDAEPGSRAYKIVAPAENLLVVHPVERPLDPPDFGTSGDPEIPVVQIVDRKIGDTNARFLDEKFTVETESTSRFDVIGEWDEVTDTPTGMTWPTRTRRSARLFGREIELPPGHPLESKTATAPALRANNSLIVPDLCQYDFRDTKHRNLVLAAVGTSRFVDYFDRKPSDHADRFTSTSTKTSALLLNTKPPRPPKVAYIVPTLGRETHSGAHGTRQVKTEGWGLRAYFTPGDWFDSGDGVKAAILFSQPPQQGRLSQIAGDPTVLAAPVVNDLTPNDFSNFLAQHASLKQVRISNSQAATTTAQPVPTYDFVSAAIFEVGYDFEKGLIFADFVLLRRNAYRPFVRLAIGRYQPDSVDGAHLSPTVFADFLQLGPDRNLSITRHEGAVYLRITGSFPSVAGIGHIKTRLVAIVETTRAGIDEEGGWDETGRILFQMNEQTDNLENAIWSVTLPKSFLKGPRQRVVVEEWEVWGNVELPDPTTGRLVYSEAIRI